MDFGLVVHAGEHLQLKLLVEILNALDLGVDRISHGIHGFHQHISRLIDQNVV